MKTWFIRGTSCGFGRAWTQVALERGDRVAATARNPDSLNDLVKQCTEVKGASQALAQEVEPLGIKVTLVEHLMDSVFDAHNTL